MAQIDRTAGLVGNTAIKAPCACATTANITLNGEQTIDGVLTSGSRVLVKNQTAAVDNGIYDSDSGAWTRAKDFNGVRDIAQGTIVTVYGGTVNTKTGWRVTNASPVIGTTALAFERATFSTAEEIAAADGSSGSIFTTVQGFITKILSSDGSSIVGFIQAGAGAVLRWVQDKLRDQLSVKDYGVLADGTDQTANFAIAKAAAVTLKKALYLPAGTYKGSLSLSSTDDGLTIRGEDWTNTILEAKDSSTATIAIAATCHNVSIENLFVKNTSGGNNGTHYGIHSLGDGAGNGSSYLHLRNVKVDGYNIPIKLDEFNGHNLESVWATGAVHGGAAAPAGANIFAGHATTHCVGLWMRDVHALSGKYGYYLETVEGLVMSDSESLLATENGLIHVTGTSGISGMQMSNVLCDSSGNGAMLLQKVFNGQFSNIWASSGVSAAGAGAFGIKLDACDNNTFQATQAYSNTTDGVWLANGSQKNSFTGLQAVTNGGDGVQIDSGCYGNTFGEPVCWSNTGKAFNFADTTADEPNIVTGYYDRGNGSSSTFQSKDVITGGNSISGREMTFSFFKTNAPDGSASSNLGAMPNTDVTIYVAPRAGSLTSIALGMNDTRAAGTLFARPTVNGAVKDNLRVQIDGTNTQYVYLEANPGSIPVAAGDRIGVFYDTDAGWDTTGAAGTVDFNVVVGLTTR